MISNPNAHQQQSKAACVHELFEAQVERTPDAIAVVFNGEQLTYRELNTRANQLAHRLLRLGVTPEALVGISLERSPEMVVALLAVLKAGGAYVPLDPAYPQERIAFMLSDARVVVLLTESSLLGQLPQFDGPRICLDTDWESIELESKANPPTAVTAENLAYVIYTSGSTGKPKGAMIEHRGLANYLNWCVDAYAVADGCGAPVHSSISFDLTVTSLFPPLLTGRTIFLLPEGIEALAAALLERENYSLVKITPAHLRALAESLPADQLAGRVRALIIGGEALHFESLSFWREHAPETRLINEYGPTETVVGCSVYEVRAGDPFSEPVPIGQAIANTRLQVLNETLQPVEPGQTGELFIGGAGVARGYLNRDELTRERFVPDTSSNHGRLYRSGDLVRERSDGQLEYLGRADDQIKVRGFRIELGEIETIIKRYPSITDCAVIALEERSGEKHLAAFFVSHSEAENDKKHLREFLRSSLPEYMIPATFQSVEALPLTINGKIDRRALESLTADRSEPATFVPARTPAEETLTSIWSEVLKLNAVSVHDNFFDLGGDSILGTLILARAARAGLKISPLQLFKHQTIAELAAIAR
jgi:amino acid adenylation domain-containing protein